MGAIEVAPDSPNIEYGFGELLLAGGAVTQKSKRGIGGFPSGAGISDHDASVFVPSR